MNKVLYPDSKNSLFKHYIYFVKNITLPLLTFTRYTSEIQLIHPDYKPNHTVQKSKVQNENSFNFVNVCKL